ncbi:MAG: aminodeoxychorismate/anthranilate synthase component II [candidate division KSB1 bacterium]|nr:aminodeoxychorismate/anthranilate synthase component II [candidate division KSB1 bacterium]
MIVMIDNYDSFTYNLVQYVGSLRAEIIVRRNDETTLKEIEMMQPERIIISPGPGYPDESGISLQVIDHFKDKCPILGVCLGHQAVGQVFGGEIVPALELVHGKDSPVHHDGKTIFHHVDNPLQAGRYHSLMIDPLNLPDCLEISAQLKDGMIMGVRHKQYPVEGVQFHPESILTQSGLQIMENFIGETQ